MNTIKEIFQILEHIFIKDTFTKFGDGQKQPLSREGAFLGLFFLLLLYAGSATLYSEENIIPAFMYKLVPPYLDLGILMLVGCIFLALRMNLKLLAIPAGLTLNYTLQIISVGNPGYRSFLLGHGGFKTWLFGLSVLATIALIIKIIMLPKIKHSAPKHPFNHLNNMVRPDLQLSPTDYLNAMFKRMGILILGLLPLIFFIVYTITHPYAHTDMGELKALSLLSALWVLYNYVKVIQLSIKRARNFATTATQFMQIFVGLPLVLSIVMGMILYFSSTLHHRLNLPFGIILIICIYGVVFLNLLGSLQLMLRCAPGAVEKALHSAGNTEQESV